MPVQLCKLLTSLAAPSLSLPLLMSPFPNVRLTFFASLGTLQLVQASNRAQKGLCEKRKIKVSFKTYVKHLFAPVILWAYK